MYYERVSLMKKNGPFGLVWRAVCGRVTKISRREVLQFKVIKTCSDLLDSTPGAANKTLKLSLYLIAELIYGTVQLHQRQGEYLLHDARELRRMFNHPCSVESEKKKRKKPAEPTEEHSEKDGFHAKNGRVTEDITDELVVVEDVINEHLDLNAVKGVPLADNASITLPEEERQLDQQAEFGQDDFGERNRREAEFTDHLSGQENGKFGREVIMNWSDVDMFSGAEKQIPFSEKPPQERTENTTQTSGAVNGLVAKEVVLPVADVLDVAGNKGDDLSFRERRYDFGAELSKEDENSKEVEISSLIKLVSLDSNQLATPERRKMQRGVKDDITKLSHGHMLACQQDWSDTMRLKHVPPDRNFRPASELLCHFPLSTRANPRMWDWASAPSRKQPKLSYREAQMLRPGERPAVERAIRTQSVHSDIEVERRGTTSTIGRQSMHTVHSTPLNQEMDVEAIRFPKVSVLSGLFFGDQFEKLSCGAVEMVTGQKISKTTGEKISRFALDEHSVLNEDGLSEILEVERDRGDFTSRHTSAFFGSFRALSFATLSRAEDEEHQQVAPFDLFEEVPHVSDAISAITDRERREGEPDDLLGALIDKQDADAILPAHQRSVIHMYGFEQRKEQLLQRIKDCARKSGVATVLFSDVLDVKCSRAQAAKSFANLLELLKLRKVEATQKEMFGPIEISLADN